MAWSEWKNAGTELILLGTGNSFDLKTNYAVYGLKATDYLTLTANDFIVEVTDGSRKETSVASTGTVNIIAVANFSKTYNPTTGVLTIDLSATGQSAFLSANTPFTKRVHLKL